MKLRSILTVGVCGAALIGGAATAQASQTDPVPAPASVAQDQAAGDSEENSTSIGEIIVTATRRNESLQRVPVAATVIGGQTWERTPNFSLETITQVAPSVTFESTSSTRNNTVRIRGVGSSTSSSGVEPSTSTVIDGVVLIRSGQASASNLIDIDRIEVLRGPQGTLFGKNASVGVVNVTTQDPKAALGGRVDAFITDDEEVQVRGTVTGGITDTLKLRVSGIFRDYNGNLINQFDGKKQNAARAYGIRGKLLWQPSDRLSVRLAADYSDAKTNCCARPFRNLNLRNTKAVAEAPFLTGITPGLENTRSFTDLPLVDDYHGANYSAQIDYEIGDYTLTSITAHQDFYINQVIDDDLTGVGPVPGGEAFKQNNFSTERVNGDTQEIRLTSPTGSTIDFVAGLFFLDAVIEQDAGTTRRRIPVPQNQLSTYRSVTRFKNYAAFGQVNVHLTEALTAILGGRYTLDRPETDYRRTDDPLAPFRGGNTAYTAQNRENDFSVKVGLQYRITPTIFSYATFAEGYKGPGFNVATNSVLATSRLRPETSDNWELGLKTRLFNDTLAFNVAAFQSDFSDFVVNAIDPATNSVQLVNAASLRTRGVEVDFDWRINRDWSIYGGAAFVKATIDIDQTPCFDYQTLAQGCFNVTPTTTVQNIRGGDLPLSPNVKFNVATNYKLRLPNLPFDVNFNTGVVYTGRQQFSLNQDPTRIQGAYALWDASLRFDFRDSGVALDLFARNIADKFYAAGMGTPTELTGSTFHYIPRDASRYVGARVTVSF